MGADSRIELTVRLWSTGAAERFAEYLDRLTSLLPVTEARWLAASTASRWARRARHRARPRLPGRHRHRRLPRDPARADFEELAGQAITRSLITDGRTRVDPDEPATLHELRPDQP